MALTLVSTVGGATSNSYKSVADLDAWLEGRPEGATFLAATPAVKALHLVGATSRLEQEEYEGTRASTTQALKFPRTGIYDDDGVAYASGAIPDVVAFALYEQALFTFRAAGTDVQASTGLEKFASLSVPGVSLTMNPAIPAETSTGLSKVARRWLSGLMTSSLFSMRTVRA